MTPEIALMLLLLLAMTVLLAMEWLPVDVTALLALVALVISGTLSPQEALSGFASEIIVMLACVFVISGTLARSGITQRIADLIHGLAHKKIPLASVIMSVAAAFSAFFSNTSATAMLLPTTLNLAKKARVRASQLMMPLAFASILGGTCTLIGTSTNLASAGLISRLGLEPYSLFEFVVPGILLTVVGIVYFTLFGRWLIPQREKDTLMLDYDVRDYLSELLIEQDSSAVGDTLGSLDLPAAEITPLALFRKGRRLPAHGNRKLQTGDTIVVRGSREALLRTRHDRRFALEAESTLTDPEHANGAFGIAEAVLMPQSRIVGKTLKQLEFFHRYGCAVLAIHRRGKAYPVRIENAKLRVGDVLLLGGYREQHERLSGDPDLWMLRTVAKIPLSTRKGVFALAAMFGAVVVATVTQTPLALAFLVAALALVLTGCTTMEDGYASIEWRLLILIASMSAFGLAMQQTGTASYIADLIATWISPLGVHATLFAFAALTVLLTQPMSNAAAALVVLPVAISTAQMLGVNPYTFAVTVTLSASLSFITPLEPASLLVFGVGRYRFLDFVRVGGPLTLVVIAVLVAIVPVLWPLM